MNSEIVNKLYSEQFCIDFGPEIITRTMRSDCFVCLGEIGLVHVKCTTLYTEEFNVRI